jgi:beta-lactamase superfamily II metal-dependent hydrolase
MAKQRRKLDVWSTIIIFSLVMIDIITWWNILGRPSLRPHIHSFDLGKTSSVLIILPNNIKIIVDSGGDDSVVSKLDSTLAVANDNYIDLAIISYPAANNYLGYESILQHYNIGAFIYDGRNDVVESKYWASFLAMVKAKNIPLITLGKGDSIRYASNIIEITAPDKDFARGADITQAALSEIVTSPVGGAVIISDNAGKLQVSSAN